MRSSLRRCDIFVKVIENLCREVKNTWTGNKGVHVSQEKVKKFRVA